MIIYTLLGSFICAAVALLALNPLAQKIGLVDRPDTRKQHKDNVPLTGGIAISIAFILFAPLSVYLLAAIAVLLIIGIADDRYNLRPLIKLIGQSAAAALLVYGEGLVITSFGTIGTRELYLGAAAAPFTIIAIVGLINAINMADGIDGLAGGLCLITLTHLLLLMIVLAHPLSPSFLFALVATIGAVTAFMIFNLNHKTFLGDSGSMVAGLLLSYFLITANMNAFPSSLTPWLIALPVIETLTLSYRRLRQRRSPFSADRTHLHHLLQDRGFTPFQTLLLMLAGALALIWIGFAIFVTAPINTSGAVAGIVFIALPFLYYRFFIRILVRHTRP